MHKADFMSMLRYICRANLSLKYTCIKKELRVRRLSLGVNRNDVSDHKTMSHAVANLSVGPKCNGVKGRKEVEVLFRFVN